MREVDVNDTELANGDDDGWLAVVLANRLPVFDAAAKKPVRHMACPVNVEGQLEALPKPLPPVASFEFALAQDWTVLATINAASSPDARVMGHVDTSRWCCPRPRSAPVRRGRRRFCRRQERRRRQDRRLARRRRGDGAARREHAGSSATQKVAAAALDPDAKRPVRDTMAQGFRLPIELYAIEKVLASRCWRTGRSPPTRARPSRR